MKELINKIKKMDKTKRIVILFITISFVFIGVFSIYNGVTGNYKSNTVTVSTTPKKETSSTTKNKKDKNTKENVEEKEDTSKQEQKTDETTKNDKTNQKDNKDQKNDDKKTSQSNSSTATSKENNKSSNVNHSQSSKTQTPSSSGQANNNQSNSSSNSSSSSQQPNNDKITINIQVIGMGNTMMAGTLNVDKNSNALSVLKTIAAKNGKEVTGSDYYVSGIGGLKEKQHGPMSGWMYSVNGVAPNMAAIKYNLKDGDKVVWYYVNYE